MKQILFVCVLLAGAWCCADVESEAVCRVTKDQGFCSKPCTTWWAKQNCAATCGYCVKVGKEPPCTGDDCPCVDYEHSSVCSLAVVQGWCSKPCTTWWAYQWCKQSCELCDGIN
ncbi:hypothetical protein ACHWQZ_G000223 [Mnemiopsis leidyi]